MGIINKSARQGSDKKVAIVGSPDLEFYGGTQVNVIQLANFLTERGYGTAIYGSGTYFNRKDVTLRKDIIYYKNAFNFDPFAWTLVQKLTRGVSEPLIGMFTSKVIYNIVKGYDKFYFTAPKFIFFSFLKYSRGNERIILGSYGTYFEYLLSKRNVVAKSLLNLFDSIFLRYARRRNVFIHALNSFQRDYYLQRGLDPEKIFVIPQCDVDFTKFIVKDNDQFRVLFLNRLSKDKGAHLIPKIAENCPDIDFTIVGDGPLMTFLRNQNMKNVKITGFLPEAVKEEEVSVCDVILNLSDYESLSISSIEGLAAGLVVVSKEETMGLKFISKEVPDSVVFPTRHLDDIPKILNHLKDEKTRDRQGILARKHQIRKIAQLSFDSPVIKDKMNKLFNSVFEERP